MKKSIITYCALNYHDAYEFSIRSWIAAGFDEIVVYTDSDTFAHKGFSHPSIKFITHFIPSDSKDVSFHCARKIEALADYVRTSDATHIAYLDADCYVRESFDEVFHLMDGGDMTAVGTRMLGRNSRGLGEANAGVVFFRNTDTALLQSFLTEWRDLTKTYKDTGVYLYEQTALSHLLIDGFDGVKKYRSGLVSERIYNSEHDDEGAWLYEIQEYGPKILHFKKRRFADTELVRKALHVAEARKPQTMPTDIRIKCTFRTPLPNEKTDKIVYTVNFGGYDEFHEPLIWKYRHGIRYIMFTDNPHAKSRFWEIVYCTIDGWNNRRASRYFKINSHLLPPHEYSMHIDASMKVRTGRVAQFFKKHIVGSSADIAAFHHKKTDCLYEEGRKCIELGLDYKELITPQLKRYEAAGFPKKYGLTENTVLLRKNNPFVKELNELWWKEYTNGSMRDQVSLMYCIWKTGIHLAYIPGNAWKYHAWRPMPHLRSRHIYRTEYKQNGLFLNAPLEVSRTWLRRTLRKSLLIADRQIGRMGIIVRSVSPKIYMWLRTWLRTHVYGSGFFKK